MLTVIIPVLNEEKTIANVVQFCLQHPQVTEVIVVDDKSEDNTAAVATAAGAKVIISQVRGKGISMKDGIQQATNEIIIFLDGDIDPYPEATITGLSTPLINDEADFNIKFNGEIVVGRAIVDSGDVHGLAYFLQRLANSSSDLGTDFFAAKRPN